MTRVRGLFCVVAAITMSAIAPLGVAAEPRSAVANEVAEPATQPQTAPQVTIVKAAPPVVTLQAKVDLSRQTLTVIEHGKTIATWKISSGTEEHATPRGQFRPEWTAKMWYSRKYDDAPMPHAVFFKNGAAIHATQATHALGRPASHGCVRLAPANAETFYRLVQRHGLTHTQIAVFGNPPYQRQHIATSPTAPQRRAANTLARNGFQPAQVYAPAYPGTFAGRPVVYANASPFAASAYPRLPISSARLR